MKKKKYICMITLILNLLLSSVCAISTVPEKQEPNSLIKFVSEDEYIVLTGKEAKENEYNENDFYEIKGIYTKENGVGIEKYPLPNQGMLVQYDSDGQVNRIYTSKNDADRFDVVKDEEESTPPIEEKPKEESTPQQTDISSKNNNVQQEDQQEPDTQAKTQSQEKNETNLIPIIVTVTAFCLLTCIMINKKRK